MAATYDYTNGQIERDFHFVRWDEKCKLSGLPCYVGSERCLHCQHNVGSLHPFSFHIRYGGRLNDSYVMCNHKDSKDSKDSYEAIYVFREQLKHDALCALCT